MSSITLKDLTWKFERLSDQAKQEAYDFIDFLFQKKGLQKRDKNKKEILLGMSVWEKDDIDRLDEVREHMNQWKPQVF